MTQWLIGIFVRFLSSKDDLINCAGVGRRTLLNLSEFFPTPFFAIIESMNNLIKSKLELLPTSPGCYIHKDKNGTIIYVGKAKNLRNRVRSYF